MTKPIERPGAKARAGARAPAPKRLPWMDPFLAALAETGVVRHACRTVGIGSTTAYHAKNRDMPFASEWDRAQPPLEFRRNAIAEARQASSVRRRLWQASFLEALAETSNVTVSAARANIPARTVYKLRRESAAFAGQWRAALLEGYDHLEMELLGYLRDPAPARKMDVAAALRLLAAHRETVERERALNEEDDEQAVRDSIDAFLEGMRQRRLANEAILLEADTDDTDDVAG